MMDKLDALMRKMDYQFRNQDLATLALTHRSKSPNNYERLEFLGDSILGFVVAEWLYSNYPKLGEGKLSRMRASLVRKETLAMVARELGLPDFLILGEGELKSGGFNRDSILADTVESLIGAIYLDSDFQHASDFIYSRFDKHFDTVSAQSNFKDAKSQLQEYMQKNGLELPEYEIVETQGEQHKRQFIVSCRLPELKLAATGTARSRRGAEQQAAATILEKLDDEQLETGS